MSDMDAAKRVIFVLSVLLIVFSLVGSYVVFQKIGFQPETSSQSVQQGEIKLTILPPARGASATGYVGFKVVPSSEQPGE